MGFAIRTDEHPRCRKPSAPCLERRSFRPLRPSPPPPRALGRHSIVLGDSQPWGQRLPPHPALCVTVPPPHLPCPTLTFPARPPRGCPPPLPPPAPSPPSPPQGCRTPPRRHSLGSRLARTRLALAAPPGSSEDSGGSAPRLVWLPTPRRG